MNPDFINYSRIGLAQAFYRGAGYVNIETPWLVTPQAVVATLPPKAKIFQSNFGCLVGSAEQSFLQMMLDETLIQGKYQSSGPCFRDEAEVNALTRMSFFKTELISYMPQDPEEALKAMIQDALQCFFTISDSEEFHLVKTDDGNDIYFGNVELGSYGIRQLNNHLWVYGTGIAEPRFSMAVQKGFSFVSETSEQTDPQGHGSLEPTQISFPFQDNESLEEGQIVAL